MSLRVVSPLLVMVASGFAGLGYQIVWTQQATLWLGHENAAVLAVVAAFFGGLGLGALWLGARGEHSRFPGRFYAICELVVALWSLVLALGMRPLSLLLLRMTGPEPAPLLQWSVAFGGTFLLLLPATAAMGATLPAMERVAARFAGNDERIAGLYAANTLGAVLGVLGTAFVLVPSIGLLRSTLVCAILNTLCAATSYQWLGQQADIAPPARHAAPNRESKQRLLVQLAGTGLLGVGYEVLVVRVLSQVTESTVYTFALTLAVYLIGTAAGAAVYQRLLTSAKTQRKWRGTLLGTLSLACTAGAFSLLSAEELRSWASAALGGGRTAVLVAEAVPALVAFGPPTLLMGGLFSHLARRGQALGIGLGRALGVNTLAAAAAPILFGVVIAPGVGPARSLALIAVGYAVLVARRSWSRPNVWLPVAVGLVLAVVAPPLQFVDVPSGGHVVSYEDGATAAVSVVADADGVSRLRINNRAQEGSSATQRVDGRQAWLPLLLHVRPRNALFLGLGTGVTASSAAEDTTLSVDAVELLPEVIRASAWFASSIADGAAYPRLHLHQADARRYVRSSNQHYDVIVADNYHPARSGSGGLYTVEHFEVVRERLTPHGVFCQWLPLHQMDRETLRSIVASFLAVYPHGAALLASNSLETPVLGLIGRRGDERLDVAAFHERLAHVALPERLQGLGLEDDFAILGSFVAGPESLGKFANLAPRNTDDRPVVAYRAPLATYAPEASPKDRIIALVNELSVAPEELVASPPNAAWSRRLAAYFLARNRYMASGRDVKPSANVEDMLAQVGQPLLDALRTSSDFRPAYDPLVRMATALARSNVSAARALLSELTRLQPARTEAPQILTLLDGGTSGSGVRAP